MWLSLRLVPFVPDPDNTGVGTGGKLERYKNPIALKIILKIALISIRLNFLS